MLQIERLRTTELHQLVENRTTYSAGCLELNLFETHRSATAVDLCFDQPVLASMIRGRKVMHLSGSNAGSAFSFLPGESILLPAGEPMRIDFPDAAAGEPTKCLALEIDPTEIRRVLQRMNETRPRTDGTQWSAADYNFHFANQPAVTQLLQRLVFLCAENHSSRDLFVRMLLHELLVRIIESESRHHHVQLAATDTTHHELGAVIAYIRGHLNEKLTVGQLSRIACMSESAFYRCFRNEMGCSPVAFITSERLQLAATLLLDPQRSIREVALRCGFNSVSYFTRTFGEHFGRTPGAYQGDPTPTSTAGN